MKISKLFHWLYALVMLLPIFAVGVTCAYAIFNKNAYQSYSEQSNETIEYNVANELITGERYYFNARINSFTNTSGLQKVEFFFIDNVEVEYTSYNWFNNSAKSIRLYLNNNDSNLILYAFDANNTQLGSATLYNEYQINFYFNYVSTNSNTNYEYFKSAFFEYTPPVEQTKTLDNVFYYSIDKVQQSPLFNWAYDSFLATPITYITGLFGIANDHISVMLMSYWLAISIIWLVFDLVMYMPLLVHRWLDKGVLE